MAQGVPGSLRPRIFLTFYTTRVVGRQPYAPAAFAAGEIPGTHFQGLSRPQGTWFRRGEPRKKSPVTPPGGGAKGQCVVSGVRTLLVCVCVPFKNLRNATYSCQVLCMHVLETSLDG